MLSVCSTATSAFSVSHAFYGSTRSSFSLKNNVPAADLLRGTSFEQTDMYALTKRSPVLLSK